MTLDDRDEAVAVLRAALTALQGAVPTQTGRTGALFRYACGDLLAQAATLVTIGAVGVPLKACFDQAVTAGATLNGFVAVRNAILVLALAGQPARVVAGGCYCLALGAEAKILSATTFTASDDALKALAVYGSAADAAQEWTADNHLPALYQSLIAMVSAVSRDLTSRAAPLPRLSTYAFPRGTTSHALACRLYGDANRADELRAENKVTHPAFMPATGIALSE